MSHQADYHSTNTTIRAHWMSRVIRWVKKVARHVCLPMWLHVDRRLVAVCRRFGFLASLYYLCWNRAFRREHRAMLEGRYHYAKSLADPRETSALLRRNVHRLEKGLLMRPRRDLYAVDYIAETVACYERLLSAATCSAGPDDSELKWAHDVLAEYFAVTVTHPDTSASRQRFNAMRPLHCPDGQGKLLPYCRDLGFPPPVSYEQLYSLARRRRSVRWFQNASVPRELLDRAVAVAAQAPSACNRQPFLFRIFDDSALVQKVVDASIGTSGYGHNIPVMAVVLGQLRHYPEERDRHLIYVDASLAAMSFVFALETQGLASCCINSPDIERCERGLSSVLGLAPDERPVLCIAIGYPDPDGLVAYSHKKPLEQLRRYN
jgi:nitroreductase